MKISTLYVILFCAIASIGYGQTFTTIDQIDWSNQIGTTGTTPAGTQWDASGNEAKNCDGFGSFGPDVSGFVFNDWEGTCGCDCIPSDPDPKCGATDAELKVSLSPAQLVAYCKTKVSFEISGTGNLKCGTSNNLSANDYTAGECNAENGDWEGTDFLHIKYTIRRSDNAVIEVEDRICGTQGLGRIEQTFDDAVAIEISFKGGTQDSGVYTIGDISIEGLANEVRGYSVFARNANNGEICQNSTLPLVLQTNATEGESFVWSGPNNFISNDKVVVFNSLSAQLSGVYEVQVTDANGCIETKQIRVTVLPSDNAACVKKLEFNSLNGIICSSQSLPSQSDNGVSGTWAPSGDLQAYGGQTVDFTFTPDDASYEAFEITIQVDDANALDNFAVQPEPVPVFCNGSAETFDLVSMFQMDLGLALTINGEEDIFDFIRNNELIQNAEAQMRAVSFQNVTPGEKVFFIEGTNTCGVNRKSFKFFVAPSLDDVIIDTAICQGDFIDYLGMPITKDTILNPGECGGSIEFRISRKSPGRSSRWIQQSFCASKVDAIYYFDTIVNNRYVGFTDSLYSDNYHVKLQDGWRGPFVLPYPAANGCDSTVNVLLSSTRHKQEVKEVELCAYQESSWVVTTATGTEHTLKVNINNLESEVAFNCDSSMVLRMIPLETQINRFSGTYCFEETPSFEIEPGRTVTFNREYAKDEFVITGTGNGCEGRAIVDLTFRKQAVNTIDTMLCAGESLIVGSEVFAEAASKEVVLSGQAVGGCDSIVTVNVQILDATTSSGELSCANPEVQLSANHNGARIVGWVAPNGSAINEASPMVGVPGLYKVIVESLSGCTMEFNHIVAQDNTPPTAIAFGNKITCKSNNQTQLSANTNGTVVGWVGDNGFSSAQAAPFVDRPGTYTVTTRAENGCESTAEIVIEADTDLPAMALSGGILTCSVTEVRLTLETDGVSYSWTGANGFTSTDRQPMVSQAGTYTVTVVGANGCEATRSASVISDVDKPIVTTSDMVLNCDVTEVTLTAITNGTVQGWTGDNGFSSTEVSPKVTTPGVYTVSVKGDNGCEEIATLTISEDKKDPTVTGDDIVLNCTTTEAQLMLTTDGTIEGWTGANGFNSTEVSPMVTAAGTYTATIKGNNGCTITSSINVTIDDTKPMIEVQDTIINCSNPMIRLSATTDGSVVSWTGPDGFSSSDESPEVDVVGDYTVTVRAANGCTDSKTMTISSDTIVPQVNVNYGLITCTNTEIKLELSTDGVSASWTGVSGFTSTEMSPTINEPGEYTVTVTGDNGCTTPMTINVLRDVDKPTVSTSDMVLNCDVTEVNLTATTNGTVQGWTGDNGFSSAEVSPVVTAPGVYTVRVMADNGCEETETLTITEDKKEPTAAGEDIVLNCTTTEAQLVLTTDGTVEGWTGTDGFNSTEISPMVTAAGTYTATIKGNNGCTITSSINVTIDDKKPTVETQDVTFNCSNPMVRLSASTDGTVVGWVGPDGFSVSEASPQVGIAGTYTVTVEATNGCRAEQTLTVSGDVNLPTVATSDIVLNCSAESANLVANTQDSVVSWSGPNGFTSAQSSPEINMPGEYVVRVQSSNGCETTETLMVTEDKVQPEVNVSGGELNCDPDASVTLRYESQGGTIVRWEGPNGFESTEESPQVKVQGDYTVIVQAANGCTNSAFAAVTGSVDIPTATANSSTILTCDDLESRLSAVSSATIVEWEAPDGTKLTEDSPMVTAPGTYTVTVRSAAGCLGYASVEVQQDIDAPTSTISAGMLDCVNDATQLAITTTHDIRGWRGPDGFASTDNSPTVSAAGLYIVELKGANGCTAMDSVEVVENKNLPQLSVAIDGDVSCAAAGATIAATTDGQISSWTGPQGFTGTQLSEKVNANGKYTVTVVGANGCETSETIDVSFTEAALTVDKIIESCEGVANGSFEIAVSNATPPFSLSGVGAERQITSLREAFTRLSAGNYNLTLTDANGCQAVSSVSVSDDREETVTVDVNVVNPLGEYTLNVNFSGVVDQVMWTILPGLSCYDCPNPSAKVKKDTRYEVTVIDPEGCRATTQVFLSINDVGTIYVPNIVSLSSRNGNNVFYPQGISGKRATYDMQIFDRWGNTVYTVNNAPINDSSKAWNGTFKGEASELGVYAYHIVLKNEFGAKKVVKGDVTIIR